MKTKRTTRTFRQEIDRLISREVRDGAPFLAIALALNQHLQRVLVSAAAARELDHEEVAALKRRGRQR